jgi:hypothetical protein
MCAARTARLRALFDDPASDLNVRVSESSQGLPTLGAGRREVSSLVGANHSFGLAGDPNVVMVKH